LIGVVFAYVFLWGGSAHAQERYSLSTFHYNIQYVAGGLMRFPDGEHDLDQFRLDDAAVQDLIVTESFVPVLDILKNHPNWKLTVEMQGYMAEVLHDRHPEVLLDLRELVSGGQVELVSYHYSDQLFLAYPRLDMVRSQQLLDRVMADLGLTLSPVVFCQEGQFGEGMAPLAVEHNQTILGLPKNLFEFQHLDLYATAAPLYTLDGVGVVIVGRGVNTPEVIVDWNFFDDGELMSTGDLNPYFGTDFKLDPESVAAYEQKLMDREAQGYRIATITEYVTWAKANNLPQPPLPPILDGTWQPASSDSMFRWMGASGFLDAAHDCERDNLVLTGNVQARHRILTAETLLSWARQQGLVSPDQFPDDLMECWRYALLGQVTDASGINPYLNEVNYAFDHARLATECADAVIETIRQASGRDVLVVDNETGTVTPMGSRPDELVSPEAPLFTEADGFVVNAPDRDIDVVWEAVGAEGNLHRVTITVSESLSTVGSREMEVFFPMELSELRISPGLIEDEVRVYPLSGFDFEEGGISLPLANGLLGLRENLWLIKDTQKVHLAATVHESDPTVRFRDETVEMRSPATWVFYLFEGSDTEALAQALRLNVHPVTYVGEAPATSSGCTCRSADGTAAVFWIFVVLLAGLRRRLYDLVSRQRSA
jgi:MYXO-CTERM domain-containing protein